LGRGKRGRRERFGREQGDGSRAVAREVPAAGFGRLALIEVTAYGVSDLAVDGIERASVRSTAQVRAAGTGRDLALARTLLSRLSASIVAKLPKLPWRTAFVAATRPVRAPIDAPATAFRAIARPRDSRRDGC